MIAPYPPMDGAFINEAVERETAITLGVIAEVRNMRGVHKAPSFKNLSGIVWVDDAVIERHLEAKRALIPAVTHIDGSGRLQTVHRETNPLYHKLISDFCSLTSVPLVLNTSFNENEPVVCRPEEALDCFLRTKMDVLVLGSFFVERKS